MIGRAIGARHLLNRGDLGREHAVPGNVVFVDDEPRVCAAIRKTLRSIGATVRCFGSADGCLANLDSLLCDLLITDVMMPGKDGIELLIEVKKQRPSLPVVVMTGFGDVPMAVRAMRAGAADFIEKPLDREALLETIGNLLEQNANQNSLVDHHLTKTERQILDLILEGRNNREIAAMLHRSPRTIEVHRGSIMHKIGAGNIVQLVRRAADLGLFKVGSSNPR